ncbi:hypothetical protein [Huintestinicola sp.]|uniref:hypothetical protein n=1 Tax=Huintestinicola sp. TaxID=2981661 RepID=UPI0011CCD7A6
MARFNIKKITAVAAAAAVMSSMTACGENTTWGATIDGSDIPAGIFIYYLQSAYYSAQSKLNEENSASSDAVASADGTTTTAAVFSSQIDGKDAKTWIYDEATKSMQEYAAIEAKFTELGLTITADEKDAAKVYCDQTWDYAGEYYTKMGISEKSFTSLYLNSQKRDKVFKTIYSEGGEYAVSDDEIKTYLDENYAMINYIAMELKDGSGNLLKSDGKAEIMSMAESYVERYKNGEDFDALNAEYTAYYDNLKAEAEAAAAEEAANAAADEAETEISTAEVTPSDAEAALEDNADEITDSAETAEDATEAPTEDTAEADETADTAEETAEADSSTTEEAADTTETSADASAEETTDSGEQISSNKTVIEKSGTTPDSAVVSKVFDEMQKGDIQIIESSDSEKYYIVLKMDVLETDEYFLSAKDSLLYEMKSEDFDALITQWTEAQNVVKNQDAYKRYDPKKLFDQN